ncbi:MAG: preprotein translocase subunit SecA [Pseudomonadota bacterium]|nr:preprotein translocase subunit SecA [Pseudomonadota bacterium]
MMGLDTVFKRVFGTRADRLIRKMGPDVERINAMEPALRALTDEQIRAKTAEFRQKLDNGAALDTVMHEAFATVREAGRRTMEMRHFDVQLIGGMVLHRGMVAEMKTGEGKTLVATLPVYLNALSGKGAHVVTVNDYLASRDAEWMGRIYRFLGLSVGTILSNERSDGIKRAAYGSDITYGTNNEFGFDYLRDNMKFRSEDYVQRGHNFAIVDEVDSILIDEARTPLIISGPTDMAVDKYFIIDGIIPLLQKEIDFTVDEKQRAVSLTDEGMDKVEARLGVDNLYDPHNMEILHHVNQALKAHFLFKRDKDYVVQESKVVIVDEHTGRLMAGRRWSDGLHQAIEAKERVTVEKESQTYATITFQNFFRMYSKLAGMTGTAETEAEEFGNIYKLEVVPIPTNRTVQRLDHHDIVYKTQAEKFRKVMQELEECYAKKQPVLVGTTSVEKSELVARLLTKKGIPHEVLNAKNHAREAEIVAQAGRLGAITISTNMAGRGTDIKLGGDPEGLARLEVGLHAEPDLWAATVAKYRAQVDDERARVMAAGGLHILGTERHESRRIDNQLRGRAGRQGDPGSSRFYLSLEDDLLRIFGSDKIIVWMERMGLKDDEPIEHRWITSSIEGAQKKVEGHNFNIRKNLLEYDDVMNLQRKAVYDLRRRALTGENVRQMMLESINALIDDFMDEHIGDTSSDSWNTEAFLRRIDEVYTIRWPETPAQLKELSRAEIKQRLTTDAIAAYEAKEKEVGEEGMRQLERMLLLQFADQFWKDHLLAMDRLRDGIGLRGYGQRNPLLEYKKEAFQMFQLMNSLRDESVVSRILRIQMQAAETAVSAPGKAMARRMAAGALDEESEPEPESVMPAYEPIPVMTGPQTSYQPPSKGAETRLFALEHGVGRNDPCPCGSGLKFKKCCYEEPVEAPSS